MPAGLLVFAAVGQLYLAPPAEDAPPASGCAAATWGEPAGGQMCLLSAPELAGQQVEAAPGETLWRQPLVFAHAARLSGELTVPFAPLRGGDYTFPAGTPLARVSFDGVVRHCALRPPMPKLKLWTGGGSFLVCFTDEDGDGALDHFYASHDPSFDLGVHLLSKGRKEREPLPSQAGLDAAPFVQGPAQSMLIRYLGPGRRKGAPGLRFGLALENDYGRPVPIEGADIVAPIGANGCAEGELRGAQFTACKEKGSVRLTLHAAMPEQDFALHLR